MRGRMQWAAVAATIIPAMAMAADSVGLSAGRWQETVTMTKATLNGAPFSLADSSRRETTKYKCLSAADAADPTEYFLQPDEGEQCAPTGTVANGRVTASADCTGDEGEQRMNIRLTGSYGRQSYELDGATVMVVDAGKLAVELKVRGRFIGACRGDEES